MKTREDFVSNSSSCSFIVHLRNEQDVEELRKIFDDIKIAHGKIYSYESCCLDLIDTPDELRPHSLVCLDCGEDHDCQAFERFENMLNLVDNDNHQFQIYKDPDAHMSAGDKLPKEIII